MRLTSPLLRAALDYVQGQTPGKFREYFYFIDHHGMLFLDDARIKNFTSCLKEKSFLAFFFSRLRRNETGEYSDVFPWISPCGRERNFVRCDDTPFVFTRLAQDEIIGPKQDETESDKFKLHYSYGGEDMAVDFEPHKLCMLHETGRLYHPAPERVGGAGLIKSALAIDLSNKFIYGSSDSVDSAPVGFEWNGFVHDLTHELREVLVKDEFRLKKT